MVSTGLCYGLTSPEFIPLTDGSQPLLGWISHSPSLVFMHKNTRKAIDIVVWFKKQTPLLDFTARFKCGVEALLPCLSRAQNFLWSSVQS